MGILRSKDAFHLFEIAGIEDIRNLCSHIEYLVITLNIAFDKIREEVKAFREHIMNKYATNNAKVDCVLNLGIQLNHITTLE